MDINYFFLHQPYGRGSGRYLRYLMDYFRGKNNVNLICGMKTKHIQGVNIYTPKIPFQIPVYQGRTDVKRNIKISKINDNQFYKLIDIFTRTGLKFIKGKNSIMHPNHCSILPYCCSLIKEKTGIPYVISAHGTGIVSSLESKRNFEIAKEGMKKSEFILSNSKFTAKQIKDNFKISSSKIKVIYLGVDTNEFKAPSKKMIEKVKKKYLCSGKKLVLSTGFLTKEKGHEDLIKAAKYYDSKGVATLISGKGPYYDKLKAMIKKSNLKCTHLIGWIPKEDLIALYAAADLYVFPSRWGEPFGMVAIEAMSCKTPVIGTNAGAIPEVIAKTGIIINPKKPKEIANAVLDNIFNAKWLDEASNKSREIVKKEFSVGMMCKNTEKIYDKIN
tara:strand:- start:5224 stop:6384 length:1161 start_codon:yes stop_codon:yes gene_type:complete